MVSWLIGAGLGPAAIAVPVNWAADALAGTAQRWFKRLRRTDDLSRLVRAATGTSVDLTQAEFDAVRKLLEDQQTWSVAGRGTVEDLATRIADCLPPRDGRTAEDAHAAALTIARGLIEFAAADLDPKLFQQVLMARLQRMETGQASSLDEALLGLHTRFESVMDQLKLVLDRLPPGPAGRGEIAVYLRTLINWLSTDRGRGTRSSAGLCSPRRSSSASCGSLPRAEYASRTSTPTGWHSGERAQVPGLGELVELRDAHPGAALPGNDPHPAAGAPGQGGVEPGQSFPQPLPQAADELGGVQGLGQLS